MSNKCKGICENDDKVVGRGRGRYRYQNGLKVCMTCEIVLNTNETKCTCCNRTLRTKPRNGRYRERLTAHTRI